MNNDKTNDIMSLPPSSLNGSPFLRVVPETRLPTSELHDGQS